MYKSISNKSRRYSKKLLLSRILIVNKELLFIYGNFFSSQGLYIQIHKKFKKGKYNYELK